MESRSGSRAGSLQAAQLGPTVPLETCGGSKEAEEGSGSLPGRHHGANVPALACREASVSLKTLLTLTDGSTCCSPAPGRSRVRLPEHEASFKPTFITTPSELFFVRAEASLSLDPSSRSTKPSPANKKANSALAR